MDLERLYSSLYRYRMFLYRVFGKPVDGILPKGSVCALEDPTPAITHGDVLHPCVRYIKDGFEGHKWWMVYTPFYGFKDALENPRLCYSDGFGEGWQFYCEVIGKPQTGFNSDPTLLFHEGKLYVFFRENYTGYTKSLGCSRVTRGCYVKDRKVYFLTEPQLIEKRRNIDTEVCPAFTASEKGARAYAFHIRFCSKIMYSLPKFLSTALHRLLGLLKELCIYDRIKCRGVAIWEADSLEDRFSYKKTVKLQGCGLFTHPWHFDIFEAPVPGGNDSLFAVIQTDDKHADIRLAQSDDGEHFRLYKKPLITSESICMKGIYKPTALVVDGRFMLYYTARDNNDRSLNRLYVTGEDWATLLQTLQS